MWANKALEHELCYTQEIAILFYSLLPIGYYFTILHHIASNANKKFKTKKSKLKAAGMNLKFEIQVMVLNFEI